MVWVGVAVTVVVGVATVIGGNWVVTGVFRIVDELSKRHPASHGGPDETDETAAPTAGALVQAGDTLRGGMAIGVLERLAIFVTLLAHYPTGITVVLAVKGLARYPELKAQSTGAAERFVIGTLVSVLVAVGGAGLAWWLRGWLSGLLG